MSLGQSHVSHVTSESSVSPSQQHPTSVQTSTQLKTSWESSRRDCVILTAGAEPRLSVTSKGCGMSWSPMILVKDWLVPCQQELENVWREMVDAPSIGVRELKKVCL